MEEEEILLDAIVTNNETILEINAEQIPPPPFLDRPDPHCDTCGIITIASVIPFSISMFFFALHNYIWQVLLAIGMLILTIVMITIAIFLCLRQNEDHYNSDLIKHTEFILKTRNNVRTISDKPFYIPISDYILSKIEVTILEGKKDILLSYLSDIYIDPHLPKLKDIDNLLSQRTTKFFLFLYIMKMYRLPKDIIFMILSAVPELIYNYTIFSYVIRTVVASKNINQETLMLVLINCPFEWFNIYYHNNCIDDFKFTFAKHVASAATNIKCYNSYFLVKDINWFTEDDWKYCNNQLFNTYNNIITHVNIIQN